MYSPKQDSNPPKGLAPGGHVHEMCFRLEPPGGEYLLCDNNAWSEGETDCQPGWKGDCLQVPCLIQVVHGGQEESEHGMPLFAKG